MSNITIGMQEWDICEFWDNLWEFIVYKDNNIRYIEYTKSSPRGYRNPQNGIDIST